MWCVSVVVAYIPVMKQERLGAQTGEVEKTFVNRIPPAARRSTLGVRTLAAP